MKQPEVHRHRGWSASEVRAYLSSSGGPNYPYREGVVSTPFGYVWAYTEENAQGGDTCLRFIWDRHTHVWSWNRGYSDRYIATLAGRMVMEITGTYGEF